MATKKKSPTQTAQRSAATIYDPIEKQHAADQDALLRSLSGQADSARSYLEGVGSSLGAGRDATATVMNLPSAVGDTFGALTKAEGGTTGRRLKENRAAYTTGMTSLLTNLNKQGSLQRRLEQTMERAARARAAAASRGGSGGSGQGGREANMWEAQAFMNGLIANGMSPEQAAAAAAKVYPGTAQGAFTGIGHELVDMRNRESQESAQREQERLSEALGGYITPPGTRAPTAEDPERLDPFNRYVQALIDKRGRAKALRPIQAQFGSDDALYRTILGEAKRRADIYRPRQQAQQRSRGTGGYRPGGVTEFFMNLFGR